MAKVGDSAHTRHGLGTVTEIETVRGRSSYRVAGRGFNVWLDEQKLHVASNPDLELLAGLETTIDPGTGHVNEDNSTTLPYDPTPQYPVDGFPREQTILPGEREIDPDKRLHPSDSLGGDKRSPNRESPGPAAHLFAPDHEFEDGSESGAWGEDKWHEHLPKVKRTFDSGQHSYPYDYGVRFPHPKGEPKPGKHEAPEEEEDNEYHKLVGSTHLGWDDYPSQDEEAGQYLDLHPRHHDEEVHSTHRPAGLSDRYAHFDLEAAVDPEIRSFRDDPSGYIEMRGYLLSEPDEHLDYKYADYSNQIDTDSQLRTAAWTDVREKALRLRHEGKVKVNDLGEGRIYATVEGDHGTYDTLIVKGGSMGGWGGGQSITNWHCSCDWGRWAFKRRFSYVGRLCSHGYACYLEMQANDITPKHFTPKKYNPAGKGYAKSAAALDKYKSWLSDNTQTPEAASIADFVGTADEPYGADEVATLYDYAHGNPEQSPERKFDVDYTNDPEKAYKTADALHTRPEGLTPNLREVPEGEDEQWVDVTKDERETTGPDQIVHFSAISRQLHGAGEVATTQDGVMNAVSNASASNPAPMADQIMASLHTAEGEHGPGWVDPTKPEPRGGGPFGLNLDMGKAFGNPFPGGSALNPSGAGPSNPFKGKDWGKAFENPFPGGSALNPGNKAPDAKAPDSEGKPGSPPAAPLGIGSGAVGKPGPGTPAVEVNKTSPAPGGGGGNGAPGGAPPASGGPAAPGGGGGGGGWSARDIAPNSIKPGDYKINSGDTLAEIAQGAGIGDYHDLAKSNNIANPDVIRAGDTIKIPGTPEATPGAGAGIGDAAVGPTPAPGAPPPPPGEQPHGAGQGAPPGPAVGPAAGTGLGATPPPAGAPAAGPAVGPAAGTGPGFNTNPALDNPAAPKTSSYRYAETSTPALLDKLREFSDSSAADSLGRMDERNGELRDMIEELHDRGVDASFMVAATNPADGQSNYPGQSNPDWADESFQGSGPDPKSWYSDSQSYLDEHGPDLEDVTEHSDGDIVKFNDSRSKPQQGPKKGSLDDILARLHVAEGIADTGTAPTPGAEPAGMGSSGGPAPVGGGAGLPPLSMPQMATASYHLGVEADDPSGYFNPDNPDAQDWEEASGTPFLHDLEGEVAHQKQNLGDMGGHLGDLLGGGGGAGGAAAGGEAAAGAGAAEAGGAAAGGASAAELAPLLLAAGVDRVGRGGAQIRIDPGFRQPNRPPVRQAALPEDFGNDGEPSLADYGESDGGEDIVASFQRSAGAAGVFSDSRGSSDDDIAAHAQAFLRTAGRKYSPQEQRELEAEFHPQGARNLPTDEDLRDTHYLIGF